MTNEQIVEWIKTCNEVLEAQNKLLRELVEDVEQIQDRIYVSAEIQKPFVKPTEPIILGKDKTGKIE